MKRELIQGCGFEEAALSRGDLTEVEWRILRVLLPVERDPANAGALAFKRSGDPNMGNFDDATIEKPSPGTKANSTFFSFSNACASSCRRRADRTS